MIQGYRSRTVFPAAELILLAHFYGNSFLVGAGMMKRVEIAVGIVEPFFPEFPVRRCLSPAYSLAIAAWVLSFSFAPFLMLRKRCYCILIVPPSGCAPPDIWHSASGTGDGTSDSFVFYQDTRILTTCCNNSRFRCSQICDPGVF